MKMSEHEKSPYTWLEASSVYPSYDMITFGGNKVLYTLSNQEI